MLFDSLVYLCAKQTSQNWVNANFFFNDEWKHLRTNNEIMHQNIVIPRILGSKSCTIVVIPNIGLEF